MWQRNQVKAKWWRYVASFCHSTRSRGLPRSAEPLYNENTGQNQTDNAQPDDLVGDAVTHAMGNEESFRLIVLTPSPSLENGKAKEMMEITKQLDITTKET